MASAPDIITYIGVPLAVLGVSPIIYTCARVMITIRNIRIALKDNALDAVIRGSIVSGVVEVELPRCSITPLTRDEAAYWEVNRFPSSLKGGSWTILHWNRLITGRQLYRLQYADELVEPQAEIDFEELLTFLLDRGAIPDKGLHTLRLGGLWSPIGTSLLLSPLSTESCLRVSLPDDGLLTLTLLWRKEWDQLEVDTLLPPSFMRLEAWENNATEPPESRPPQNGHTDIKRRDCENQDDNAPETKLTVRHMATKARSSMSIRFSIKPYHETFLISNPMYELDHRPHDVAPPCLPLVDLVKTPFPPLCIAMAHLKSFPLWTCHLPPHLISLSKKDIIPSGVLVMLGILAESDAPPWETKRDPFEDLNAFHTQSVAQSRARQAESMMPPAQAEQARRTREIQERDAFHNNFVQRMRRDAERAERRKLEALQSVKFSNGVVAERGALWLKENAKFGGCKGVIEVGERVLYLTMKESEDPQQEKPTSTSGKEEGNENMGNSSTVAFEVLDMLTRWEKWAERGGMNKEDLSEIKDHLDIFCRAAVLMGILRMAADKEESQVAVDIREVVRTWRRVRLG